MVFSLPNHNRNSFAKIFLKSELKWLCLWKTREASDISISKLLAVLMIKKHISYLKFLFWTHIISYEYCAIRVYLKISGSNSYEIRRSYCELQRRASEDPSYVYFQASKWTASSPERTTKTDTLMRRSYRGWWKLDNYSNQVNGNADVNGTDHAMVGNMYGNVNGTGNSTLLGATNVNTNTTTNSS